MPIGGSGTEQRQNTVVLNFANSRTINKLEIHFNLI